MWVKKMDTLRRDPSRCPLAAESDKFPEEIRELLCGRGGKRVHKHCILFTVRGDTVLFSMSVTLPVTSWNPDVAPRPRCRSSPAANRRLRPFRRQIGRAHV